MQIELTKIPGLQLDLKPMASLFSAAVLYQRAMKTHKFGTGQPVHLNPRFIEVKYKTTKTIMPDTIPAVYISPS